MPKLPAGFTSGQVLTADDMQSILDALLEMMRMTASAPLQLQRDGGGWRISLGQTITAMPIICYAPNGIPAASGDITGTGLTPGSASDVVPCYFDGTKWKKQTDLPFTVQNMSKADSVAANETLIVIQVNGIWQVIWEECA
jgi:hypothetical protein